MRSFWRKRGRNCAWKLLEVGDIAEMAIGCMVRARVFDKGGDVVPKMRERVREFESSRERERERENRGRKSDQYDLH